MDRCGQGIRDGVAAARRRRRQQVQPRFRQAEDRCASEATRSGWWRRRWERWGWGWQGAPAKVGARGRGNLRRKGQPPPQGQPPSQGQTPPQGQPQPQGRSPSQGQPPPQGQPSPQGQPAQPPPPPGQQPGQPPDAPPPADDRPSPGQMSTAEARQLLDSAKSDEHHSLLAPSGPRNPDSPPDKAFKNLVMRTRPSPWSKVIVAMLGLLAPIATRERPGDGGRDGGRGVGL